MTVHTKVPFSFKNAAVPTRQEIAAFRKLTREEQDAVIEAELEKGRQSGPPTECSLDDIWQQALEEVQNQESVLPNKK